MENIPPNPLSRKEKEDENKKSPLIDGTGHDQLNIITPPDARYQSELKDFEDEYQKQEKPRLKGNNFPTFPSLRPLIISPSSLDVGITGSKQIITSQDWLGLLTSDLPLTTKETNDDNSSASKDDPPTANPEHFVTDESQVDTSNNAVTSQPSDGGSCESTTRSVPTASTTTTTPILENMDISNESSVALGHGEEEWYRRLIKINIPDRPAKACSLLFRLQQITKKRYKPRSPDVYISTPIPILESRWPQPKPSTSQQKTQPTATKTEKKRFIANIDGEAYQVQTYSSVTVKMFKKTSVD